MQPSPMAIRMRLHWADPSSAIRISSNGFDTITRWPSWIGRRSTPASAMTAADTLIIRCSPEQEARYANFNDRAHHSDLMPRSVPI